MRWVLLLLLLPAGALAQEGTAPAAAFAPELVDLGLFLRVGADVITDRSFDVAADNDALARLEVGASWNPGWAARRVSLEVVYGFGSTSALVHATGNARLQLNTVGAGAVYTLPLARALAATGSLGLGLQVATLSMADGTLSDTALAPEAHAAVGLELLVPFGRGDPRTNHLAFSFDLGRAQDLSNASFDGLTRSGEGVRAAPVEVGSLDLSAWTWRLGLAARF